MVNIQKTKQNFLITKSEKVYLDNLSFQESLIINIKFLDFENKEEIVLYSIKEVSSFSLIKKRNKAKSHSRFMIKRGMLWFYSHKFIMKIQIARQ